MNNIFARTSALWIRYDRYEYRTDENGVEYLTPCKDATLTPYEPLKEAKQLVMDALEIGMHVSKLTEENTLKERVLDFVNHYGLLGLMTALPTTPEFITYEAVYLPKNHFLKEESMSTEEYLAYFFPFDPISFVKKRIESMWSIDQREMIAVAIVMQNKPQAVLMSFQKEYAEPFDWIVQQLQDWAFTFMASFLYYQDKDVMPEEQLALYREGVKAYGGIAPTYHIELAKNGPKLVWDFHSLSLGIQMMLSFMITDEKSPLKVCKHCGKVFVASRPDNVFCSPRCKNQYNVYKSRGKDKD